MLHSVNKKKIGIRFKKHLKNIKNQVEDKSLVAENKLNHCTEFIKLLKQFKLFKISQY